MINKKVVSVSLAGITMLSSTVGYSVYKDSANNRFFAEGGYILQGMAENKNIDEVQHFEKGSKYRERWSEQVEFQNTEGENVSVDKDSFIHYNNQDISAIGKGVLIDTNTLGEKNVKSYGTPEFAETKKTSNGYTINNLDEEIPISDYIWKISDNKYILVSDQIELEMGQGKTETVNDYVEVTYVDDGIVRLSNDSYNYQTIASSAKVRMANDAEIDLNSKDILANGEVKTSLTKMVVDSNDNVEIVQNKNNKNNTTNEENAQQSENNQNGENGNGQQNNNNNNNTNNSNNNTNNTTNNGSNTIGGLNGITIGGQGSGSGSGSSATGDEVIVQFVEPVFAFSKFDPSAIGFDATVSVIDDQKVLKGEVYIELYERDTNKLVYTQVENEGSLEFNINVGNLKSGADYILKVNSAYEFNGQEYEKTFINKQFTTASMGLTYSRHSATEQSISIAVNTDSTSKANSGELVLYNKSTGEKVSSQKVNLVPGESKVVNFDNLDIDTQYTVKLENVLYDSTVSVREYDAGIDVATLKGAPVIGKPIVKIDKKNLNFKLSLESLQDKYNGVTGLTYEIFDVTDLENPVYTVSKNALSEIDVKVDNVKLFKGTNYVYRVVVDYYDNEKTVEYTSSLTDPFTMEGVQLAKIKEFRDQKVRFDKIEGVLVIDDPENTISADSTVTWSLSDHSGYGDVHSGESVVSRSGDEVIVPINQNDLRANQSYDLSVMAEVDLKDGTGAKKIPLGSIVVRTNSTKPLKVEFGANELSSENRINFNMQLKNAGSDDTSYEASTISEMKIKLYKGTKSDKEYLGETVISDEDIEPYVSTIKQNYYDQPSKITDEILNEITPNLDAETYVVEIAEIYDYTTAKNQIPIDGENMVEIKSNEKPPSKEELRKALKVTAVTKADTNDTDDKILNDTVVKVRLGTEFETKATLVGLKYNVYVEKPAENGNASASGDKVRIGTIDAARNSNSKTINKVQEINIVAGTGKAITEDINDMIKNLNDGKVELIRGYKYYFNYEATFDLDGDGKGDYTVKPNTESGTTYGTKAAEENTEVINGWVDKELVINKQKPTIKIYSKDVTNGSSTNNGTTNTPQTNNVYNWKFGIEYKDLDNALVGNDLEVKVADNTAVTEVDIADKNQYNSNNSSNTSEKDITISGVGKYQIIGDVKYNNSVANNELDKTDEVFSEFYFDGITDISKCKYTIESDDLVFKIKINGDEATRKKITKIKVSLTKVNDSATKKIDLKKEYTLNESGEAIIPYIDIPDLSNFKGNTVQVEVKAKYDTGVIDLSENEGGKNALLQINNLNETVQYLKYSGGVGSVQNSASGATLTNVSLDGRELGFSEANNVKYLYEQIKGSLYVSNIGSTGQKTNILVKKESDEFKDIKSNSSNSIEIPNVIPPSIRLIEEQTEVTINSIKFGFEIDKSASDEVESYTVELYEGDTKVGEKKFEGNSITTNNDKIKSEVTFGGDTNENMLDITQSGNNNQTTNEKYKITFNTTYKAKVKVKLKNGTTKEAVIKANDNALASNEMYLKTSENTVFNPEFTTLGKVDISDFTYKVSAKDTNNNRKLVIENTVSAVSLLNEIEYKLEVVGEDNSSIIQDVKAESNGKVKVEFDIKDNLKLGKDYKLTITPKAKGSNNTEVPLEESIYNFRVANLSMPNVTSRYETAIKKDDVNKATATMTINLTDTDGVMKSIDEYKLVVSDEKGNVYENDKDYTITVIKEDNRSDFRGIQINFKSLPLSTKINANITANCDTLADGTYDETFDRTFTMTTVSSSGINIGSPSLMVSSNKLAIAFKDSIGLVSTEKDKGAKYVKYTIYNSNGDIVKSHNGNFAPTSYPNNNLYVLPLDYQLSSQGVYRVELSLYDYKNQLIDHYTGEYINGFVPKVISKIKNFFK